MLLVTRRPLASMLGGLVALGLCAYAVDDMSALLQGKVGLPAQDQDDLDLEAAEAEISKEQEKMAQSPPQIVKEVAPRQAATNLAESLTDEEAKGVADAEFEAMQAELAEEGEDEEAEEGEEAEQEEEEEEESEDMTLEKAKQALRQRIAERAKLAQASNYSFTVGSIVYVQGKKAKVAWDGRPDHEFVKVTWQEGPQNGKTSGIIDVEDCWLEATKTMEVGTGRHLKKRVTSATQLTEKKKKSGPRVRDTTRRRRSVLRRIVYGIKKMPMVMTIPFKGLKTGVDTIANEMTAHTGLAFNGSLIDLLNVGGGSAPGVGQLLPGGVEMTPEQMEMEVAPRKPRKNITELVRNKTYAAVMKFQHQHLQPLMTSFTNEIRRAPEHDSNLTVHLDPALLDPQLMR